ncbi:MAG TPA: hypothetical protein VFA63_07865 [Pseudonocardiaceae bacterium]|nr:hypothetical protein [Pseudonocardiaceae bacterium]
MLTPEESRKLGWVPYVMDFSYEDNVRFAAAIAVADDLAHLPQWVKEAADAADRRVGIHVPGHVVDLPHQRIGGVAATAPEGDPLRHLAESDE